MKPATHDMRQYRYSPLTRYGRNLIRKINRAMNEYPLIGDDDRVCVAVSGGKDSLSLVQLLLEHKRFYNGKFEVAAIHVISDYNPRAAETRDYLERVFRDMGIGYDFVEIEVTRDLEGNEQEPGCFLCSWKRRKALFSYCADNGFTKLALGHHMDDMAETSLLNLVYHGTLETMLPIRRFFDGKFDVIRPLFYLREKDLARYARMAGFDTTICECPASSRSKRLVMKEVLRGLGKESKLLYHNVWRASRTWHEAVGDHPLHATDRASDTKDKTRSTDTTDTTTTAQSDTPKTPG
jgi:tRNA 2-thiocytidine biosynthesis protein TtcA